MEVKPLLKSNKIIIILPNAAFFQKHEVANVKTYKEEIVTLKEQLAEMKGVETQLKNTCNRVNELEAMVAKLSKEVEVRIYHSFKRRDLNELSQLFWL